MHFYETHNVQFLSRLNATSGAGFSIIVGCNGTSTRILLSVQSGSINLGPGINYIHQRQVTINGRSNTGGTPLQTTLLAILFGHACKTRVTIKNHKEYV